MKKTHFFKNHLAQAVAVLLVTPKGIPLVKDPKKLLHIIGSYPVEEVKLLNQQKKLLFGNSKKRLVCY